MTCQILQSLNASKLKQDMQRLCTYYAQLRAPASRSLASVRCCSHSLASKNIRRALPGNHPMHCQGQSRQPQAEQGLHIFLRVLDRDLRLRNLQGAQRHSRIGAFWVNFERRSLLPVLQALAGLRRPELGPNHVHGGSREPR